MGNLGNFGFLRSLFAALLVCISFPISSHAGVDTTKHNLSVTGTGTYHAVSGAGSEEICIFCHTPHHARTNSAALWNRADSSASYAMYSSPSLKMTISAAPSPVSLACLSCHDGTLAFDQLVYRPQGAALAWNNGKAQLDPSALTNLSADLRDDHPISIQYDHTKRSNMETLANVKAKNFPFYGGSSDMLECSTCHDPHNNQHTFFLRSPRQGMCLQCHLMNN